MSLFLFILKDHDSTISIWLSIIPFTSPIAMMGRIGFDVPWWQHLVNEIDKTIINRGYIAVPDTPGLGVTLNDDVMRQHLASGVGYFEPTPMWDTKQSFDDQVFS